MTVTAYNLATDEEYEFSPDALPEWAVAYGYCTQDEALLSELFHATFAQRFHEFAAKLPLRYGKHSVACGDWACKKIGARPDTIN